MRSTSLDLTAAEVVADPDPWFAEECRQGAIAWHPASETWLTFTSAAAAMPGLEPDRDPESRGTFVLRGYRHVQISAGSTKEWR